MSDALFRELVSLAARPKRLSCDAIQGQSMAHTTNTAISSRLSGISITHVPNATDQPLSTTHYALKELRFLRRTYRITCW
jgi:hypothetical protein